MPSPLGHALGGLAAGALVIGRRPLREGSPRRRDLALLALVGMLPDADLLIGLHSGPTHGLGAAAVVGLAAMVLWRLSPAAALAVAGAYASHTLLDWLGNDTSPPIGIMALWPFSRHYFQSDLRLFQAISRRYWLPGQFIWGNLRAVLREVLILGPIATGVLLARGGVNSQRPTFNSQGEPRERVG